MKQKKFLVAILVTYVAAMMIPLVFGIITNEYLVLRNAKKVVNVLDDSFQANVRKLNVDFEQINNAVGGITTSPALSRFFYDEISKGEITSLEIIEFKKVISSYHFNSEIVQDVLIYSSHLDMIICPTNIYINPVNYFNDNYRKDGSSAKETTDELIYGETERYIGNMAEGNNQPVIEVIQTVPLLGKNVKGKVIVFVKVHELFESFESVVQESGGAFEVYYHDNLLYTYGEKNTTSYERFEYKLPSNSIRLKIFIPKDFLRKDVKLINLVLLILYFIVFVICCAMCFYFASKKSYEYEKILNKILSYRSEITISKKNFIGTVGSFIDEIMETNNNAEKKIAEITKIKDENICIRKLVTGEFRSESEAKKSVKENKIFFSGENYTAMLISVKKFDHTIEQNAKLTRIISETLSDCANEFVPVAQIDHDSFVAVLSGNMYEEEFYQYIKECVSTVKLKLVYELDVETYIGVGSIEEQLIDLKKSFLSARKVIHYIEVFGEDKYVFAKELPTEEVTPFYSEDIEKKILQYINLGDREKAVQVLMNVKNQNLSERILPIESLDKLKVMLCGTLIKINNNINDKRIISFREKSLTELFDYTVELITLYTSDLYRESKGRADFLCEELIKYIDENFMLKDMSLSKLAAKFSLSEAYISVIFKKKTGSNFSNYVEKLRISKACELIETLEYKINTIVELVGYSSDVNFRRSFKKIMGMTPSEYYTKIKSDV